MKPGYWLLYLVIFSLALNLGTISTLAYLHYQGPPLPAPAGPPPMPMHELWGAIKFDPKQRQAMQDLFPEHHRRVMDLRTALAQKRGELLNLMQQEAPDWQALRAKVKDISNLQGQLEEEMLRFMVETKKLLKPEQRRAFLSLMQARLERGGPPGRHGGPPPGRWGFDKGPGMGPGPGMGKGPGPWPPGPSPPSGPPGPPPPGSE